MRLKMSFHTVRWLSTTRSKLHPKRSVISSFKFCAAFATLTSDTPVRICTVAQAFVSNSTYMPASFKLSPVRQSPTNVTSFFQPPMRFIGRSNSMTKWSTYCWSASLLHTRGRGVSWWQTPSMRLSLTRRTLTRSMR